MRNESYMFMMNAPYEVQQLINRICIESCMECNIPIPCLFVENIKTTPVVRCREKVATRLREEIGQDQAGRFWFRKDAKFPMSYPNIAGVMRLKNHVTALQLCRREGRKQAAKAGEAVTQ